MAAPAATYSELLTVAHERGVGYTFRGFTLTAKTLVSTPPARNQWEITVTRSGNTWTIRYSLDAAGNIGRIYGVVDDSGRVWYKDPVTDGWR